MVDPETVQDAYNEFKALSQRPIGTRMQAIRFLHFHQTFGTFSKEVVEAAIYHMACIDSEEFRAAEVDPVFALLKEEEMSLAAAHGMATPERNGMYGGWDQLPGMDEIDAKLSKRMREIEIMHLTAWGEKSMARRLTADPECFADSYKLLCQFKREVAAAA